VDRLRQRGIEPKQLAIAAAALFFGIMFIRRRRRPGRDG
jgi:hypothetical protein